MIDRVLAQVRAYPAKRGNVGHRIAGDLYAWYVVEGPDGVTPLTERAAADLGLTRAALREEVATNIWTRIGGVTFHRRSPEEPYTVLTGTQLTASSLLLDDLWEEIRHDMSGELIVRVVKRSLLICAGTGEPEAMGRLLEGAEARTLLRWRGGWEPWSANAAVAYAA